METMKKFAEIHTLGCRLNIADSALLTARIRAAGYELSPGGVSADLIVLNSCAITAEAAAKSRRMVRRMRRENPGAKIIVTGCASQLDPESFISAGADLSLPNAGKKAIPEGGSFQDESPLTGFREDSFSEFPFRSRAFIKIQEGCNNFCTYCIVPYVRGRERSRALDEVIADCRNAVEAGFPEIVLTGVNTCAYSDDGKMLGDLIYAISELPGDFRIRLSSTEPHFNNRNLIDIMAGTPKICRFLHLSLQYGCDRILQAMNRHYTTSQYADFVAEAREKIPGLHIGTDIIAGFPGETDEDFEICSEFVNQMQFANAHIFTYSPRPGTPAATMSDRPDSKTAGMRAARLREITAISKQNFIRSQLGKELQVIFETSSKGMLHGWSDNYIAVSVPENTAKKGRITFLKATEDIVFLNGNELPQL